MKHHNNVEIKMRHRNRWTFTRWTFTLLMTAVLPLAPITSSMAAGKSIGKASGVVPAVVTQIPGSDINQVTLTEKAAQRIGLQTLLVREAKVAGTARKIVPYSSLIYDPHGATWVYTSPQPLTFVRTPISVDFIKGDWIVLREGPPVGTRVATVGVAELYGTDFQVGH